MLQVKGLARLRATVALPRIGAGVGGLHWDEVLHTIKEAAKLHPGIDVEVWEFSVR